MNNRLYGKLIFELSKKGRRAYSLPATDIPEYMLPQEMRRAEDAQLPECDELTIVRHYTSHSGNNFGVNNGMYPLGSCTMKYNPLINEEVASLPQFNGIHPSQPAETCQGTLEVCHNMQRLLTAITGMAAFTLNPFAGAHGELTGLMIIRKYHESRGDTKRDKVIVPDSAHGTNPASASVCGLKVVEVKSNANGTVDLDALRPLLEDGSVAAMMMTNPNTLGLFERDMTAIADMVHACGALMYYDGANLNPLLGVCRPADMGFDVMHINLHKTFSTPHGGGGPGAGPVGVRAGLEGLLPAPRVFKDGKGVLRIDDGTENDIRIGTHLGNYLITLRAYCYILSLGKENLKMVGPLSTLNANYLRVSLKDVFELPIDALCKHEFVFNGLKDKSTGVTTMNIAKRLLDYGYHAPTIYFPLLFHEAMMIEPTENESIETLDSFIAVMRAIAHEAATDPETVIEAPTTTPVLRVDEVMAAKHPVLTYKALIKDERAHTGEVSD